MHEHLHIHITPDDIRRTLAWERAHIAGIHRPFPSGVPVETRRYLAGFRSLRDRAELGTRVTGPLAMPDGHPYVRLSLGGYTRRHGRRRKHAPRREVWATLVVPMQRVTPDLATRIRGEMAVWSRSSFTTTRFQLTPRDTRLLAERARRNLIQAMARGEQFPEFDRQRYWLITRGRPKSPPTRLTNFTHPQVGEVVDRISNPRAEEVMGRISNPLLYEAIISSLPAT